MVELIVALASLCMSIQCTTVTVFYIQFTSGEQKDMRNMMIIGK